MKPFLIWIACFLFAVPGRGDDRLQRCVNRLMRGRDGAIIVSNPQTGEILAEWNHEGTFKHAFPPGSTAKLVTCAVALEEGVISPSDRIYCRRVPELLGGSFHCSHPPALDSFTVSSALANSCNYFFAALSARVDAQALEREYALFGFSDIDKGHAKIPNDPAAKARAALGESPVVITPARLLQAYSAVATKGTVYELSQQSRTIHSSVMERRINLRLATWNTIAAGLEECINHGTCQAAAVKGVRVTGKTGTANAPDGRKSTGAWFAGYAPAQAPKIAVVVFVAKGTGARDAAPIAGDILREYFRPGKR